MDELHPNSKQPTIGLETAVPIVSILIVKLFADFTSGKVHWLKQTGKIARQPEAHRNAVDECVSDA